MKVSVEKIGALLRPVSEEKGTPRSLIEAVENGLAAPRADDDTRSHFVKEAVQDFLAQQFTIAMYDVSPEEERRLRLLFGRITGRILK